MPDQPPKHHMQINMPEAIIPGIYADFVGIWHTAEVFVLDFAVMAGPTTPVSAEDTGEQMFLTQAQTVARIRIPPAQVFEVMKVLEQHLSAWETETGKRPPAGGLPGLGDAE